KLPALEILDAHHVRRHESLADALRGHQERIGTEPRADVAVVRSRIASRVHAPADLDDVGAERGFRRHAVRARYLSRQAGEQKQTRCDPTSSVTARSGSTNVPQTGSRTMWPVDCERSARGRPDSPSTSP